MKNSIDTNLIKEIYEENINYFNKNDEYFLKNVYSKSIEKYIDRLKQIDFYEGGTVLDFGCGYGQWTFALSHLNLKVIAYDYDPKRIKICNKIKQKANASNVVFTSDLNKIKELNYDLILSYSVIQLTKYEETLDLLFNLLKKDAKIYFTLSDLGWYLYNLNERNDLSFDKQKWFSNTIRNSIEYYFKKKFIDDDLKELIIPKNVIKDFLNNYNFKKIYIDDEGKIQINKNFKGEPFFDPSYKNLDSIYEVICIK